MAEVDATEVGVQAARVMEDLEEAAARGALGDEPRVLAAAVLYEVRGEDGVSIVGIRITDDRSVIGHGLLARGREALRGDEDLTNPDDD